jgi:hypothetical protein
MRGLHAIIDDNLHHVEPALQATAGACLRDFLLGYGDDNVHVPYVRKYCSGLFDSDSPYVRSGSGVALAAMPRNVVEQGWATTLEHVCRACNVETVPQTRDVEARVKAIEVRRSAVMPIYM